MKSCVIVFPASNCDRDAAVALEQVTRQKPTMVWYQETGLPETDFIMVPGGFSYGDYLRAGAMAARAPIMAEVAKRARAGVPVLGVCNGFQILTEAGLLPGVLMRNAHLKFFCGMQTLRVENTNSIFTRGFANGQYIDLPVAHHDGNYTADVETLDTLEGDGRIAFRYVANPNGSDRDIAGILDDKGRILGMMPHPERAIVPALGSVDGALFLQKTIENLAA